MRYVMKQKLWTFANEFLIRDGGGADRVLASTVVVDVCLARRRS